MTISTSQRTRWLTALVLVIAVWLAFWPALNNDFVNYDDGNYIVNNTNIQQGVNWSSLKWAFTSNEWSNWHPLTWISHMIDWQLFGRNPAGHHAVNIALHSLNAVLLLFGLASLTGAWWRSALVAFLFALHPLRVESVAWVAERKDLLSACFGLLAIGCYIRYARALSWRWYVGTLVLTACSLMAKPTLVTMPCILLLLDFWPLGRMKAAWINAQQSAANRPASREGFTRIVLEKLPLMVLAAISSKLTIWAQVAGHSVVSEQVLTMNLRIENAVVSYAVYLWQMIWPNHLAVLYLHPTSWSASMVTVCSCVLFLISGIVMLSRKPSIIVSWFWYLGTLVPVIGIVQVGAQAHADRYTYIPMIGVLVAIIWLIPEMMFHRPLAAFLASLSVALCITLGALTWIQTRHWRSSIALWQHTLQVTTEDNAIAQVCLAAAMVRNGSDPALADAHARKALQLDARYVADHDIYDSSLIQQERYADAIAFLELVIQQLPESAHVHGRLGELYYKTKNLDQAHQHFQKAISLQPNNARNLFIDGMALAEEGWDAERDRNMQSAAAFYNAAVASYQRALALEPKNAEGQMNLGKAWLRLRQPQHAIASLREAIRINDRYVAARNELATALAASGDLAAAQIEFRNVLAIDPNDETAGRGLALIQQLQERAKP